MCRLWGELKDDGIRTFCVEQILAIMLLGTLNVCPQVMQLLNNCCVYFIKGTMVSL